MNQEIVHTGFHKMNNIVLLALATLLSIFLQSCGIFGIHFQVHNPKKEGETPKFSMETILLGELTKYRTCYDVHYYDLAVELHPNSKMISGQVTMYANAKTNFDTLQMDLDQQFTIHGIFDAESGRSLNYKRSERAIYIEKRQEKGSSFQIVFKYEGKPIIAKKAPWKGGFVWKKDKQKNDWIGVACESDGASIWWPLKDHTSDEPDSMRMHYTVPGDLVSVGNGQFEGKTSHGHKTTYNWFVSYPINTYNVTIYAGKYKLLKDSYLGIHGDQLEIQHYVLDEHYEKAKTHFNQVHRILKVYEEKFGEYPWYRDGFKLVESPYMGMEHQTAIAYGNAYKNDLAGGTDYIILHEAAHEWWGNSITAFDLSDVWLQEGFATYAEALYLEDILGNSHYEDHLRYYRWLIKNKYPLIAVSGRRFFHFRKHGDVYTKGAWILHSLRMQLQNDQLFFRHNQNIFKNL